MSDCQKKEVPFKIVNPERIPAKRYYDKEFFALENEHLWSRTWQMAARLEEIPQIGDWVEYRILDKSVIIVRTKDGIKGYHNACRHRGVELAEGRGNCRAKGFICPFHGWRWDMDGKNTYVYGRDIFSEANLDQADLNLPQCRAAIWGDCVYINFDLDAAPLLECIKPAADRLDPRNIADLKAEWWVSTILPANWKLAMEAFMEGYHVMKTHPQLYSVPTPGDARYGNDHLASASPAAAKSGREVVENAVHHMELLGAGMGGMVHARDIEVAKELLTMELPEDPMAAVGKFFGTLNAEIVSRAKAKGINMPDLNALMVSDRASPVQFVFPNYFLLPMFGNMSAYRIRPLTEETCLFELWSLILYPEDEVRAPPVAPKPMPHDDPSFPEIPRQDYSNIPRQQRGLHAHGFEFMRLSHKVEGIISNYQRTIDAFLSQDVPKEKLVKAMQVSCGTLDEPIADLGLD